MRFQLTSRHKRLKQTAGKMLLAWSVASTLLYGAVGRIEDARASENEAPAPVRQVDLRPVFSGYNLTIKRQGARDTCHVFTVVAALEFAVAQKYDYGVGLSEEYLNWAANQASQQWQDGASFVELAQALKRWGISEEQHMPYVPAYNPAYQPRQAALDSARQIHKLKFRWHWIKAPNENAGAADRLNDAHIEAMKNVLRRGWPVCAGREHNILIVGFRDNARQPGGGAFIVRNSNSNQYRSMTYQETKAKSGAALWIDLPLDE